MLQVKVKTAAGVTRFMPEGVSERTAEVPENSTVADLLDSLAIPRKAPSIILINKSVASLESKLQNGDIVHLLPMVVGG